MHHSIYRYITQLGFGPCLETAELHHDPNVTQTVKVLPKLPWVQEMSTAERFNTSTTVTITVVDGDDQYPQFLPCTLLFQDPFNRICISPVYTVNVTEGQEVRGPLVLSFSLHICIMSMCQSSFGTASI